MLMLMFSPALGSRFHGLGWVGAEGCTGKAEKNKPWLTFRAAAAAALPLDTSLWRRQINTTAEQICVRV